ncbi:polysaccharide lyase family 7 protein [Psychromonas hadalis]|uniref:polysaccharide lyase family 7 protein n=1 Tax=Psychromonas hadalis TaxID=211669 RepID=UPI0003B714BE|nr:polysaccharide lyase family 7 protein [Psychromonas hadalis]
MKKVHLSVAIAAFIASPIFASEGTSHQSALATQLDPSKAPSENFEMQKWKINLPIPDNKVVRQGKEMEITAAELNNVNYPYVHPEWFYTDSETGAMVFASPNTGPTTPNTKNTRSELRAMLDVTQAYNYNSPLTNFALSTHKNSVDFGAIGGQLSATLTVDAVSTSGNDKKMGAHAVIIGQIHGSDNEPLKIYYRKMPNHSHGSLFWNYEINATGDNYSKRFDISHNIFGSHDLTKVDKNPKDGIKLGELFSYDVNFVGSVMHLEFKRNIGEANEQVETFELDLAKPYPGNEEFDETYAQDWMYYKAGAYNQCNQGSAGCLNRGVEEGDYTKASFYELILNQ